MINDRFYQVTYNPDGGDLGRAFQHGTTPLEFQIVLPHIAYMLEALYRANFIREHFVYAFEFNVKDKALVELVMLSVELPEHVSFYETDGKKLFEMRGSSGGITTGLICYLVTK